MDAAALLGLQMDEAWDLLVRGMADVDDVMLHWRPAPTGCWELRPAKGRWVPDYHGDGQRSAGPKTIGWLAAHLAACKEMYFEYAFGERQKRWDDLTVPGDAAGLRDYLVRTHAPLRRVLQDLDGDALDRPTLTNWGESKAVWWILWTMVLHDLEHAGQIWQVKNQYRVAA